MEFCEAWEDTCSSVGRAARVGSFKQLKQLVRMGRPVDAADNRGWRPLHEAAAVSKDLRCLEELLKHGKSDVNWQTHEGETALLLACKRRHGEDAAIAVRMLLRYGANVNISDNEEETPLLAACRAGSTLVVKLLVDTGQPNVNVGDCSGWHPLHEAATTGNLDIVQILLASNSMLDVQDECRMTPVFTAAQHGRYQCLKILLDAMKERGQERLINRGAEDWATPLMIAAQQGFTDCVELLLSYRANPNLRTVDNVTALHLAVQGNHVESVRLLLEHMDIGQLIKLCQRQDVGVLQQAEEEATTDYVVSPLHLAIEWQSYGCLQLLLTSGFPADGLLERSDLTLETLHGGTYLYETALTFAASKGDVEGMNILLEAGASCEATLDNVLPPLVPAILCPSLEPLHLLLKHQCGLECKNGPPGTYLLVAIKNVTSLECLLKHGADPGLLVTCGLSPGTLVRALFKSQPQQDHIIRILKMLRRYGITSSAFRQVAHTSCVRSRELFSSLHDETVWTDLLLEFDSPNSLAEICRFYARHIMFQIYGPSFHKQFEKLMIPIPVIQFLNHTDEI
ncbi:uncharacterized protein LOC143248940 isoform X2 [Tachypleus tridentatus]